MPSRNVLRRETAAAGLALFWLGLAAPAAAQSLIGPGSGRTGAVVAWLIALMGVVIGAVALRRARAGIGRGGRRGARVALVLAVVGTGLAALHLATNPGAVGSGHGRAGAILAVVLGLIGIALGRLALVRSARAA